MPPLERVLQPNQEEAIARADAGEMSTSVILDALRLDDDPTDQPAEADGGMRLLPSGSDPWGSLGSREAEYARIEDEGAPKAVVDEKSLQGGKSVAASVETMLRERFSAASEVALVASDCGQHSFSLSDYTSRLVVQLDLTNNKLSHVQSLVGNGFLWLRELKLTGNRLEGWPSGLEALPALLSLDLSFNPGLKLAGADLSPLVHCLKLDLAGCDLSSLTADDDDDEHSDDEEDKDDTRVTPLSACISLTDLNLAENEFRRLGALAPLRQLPQLRILDVQDNDDLSDVGEAAVKRQLLARLPGLRTFNGDNTGMGSGASGRAALVYEGSGVGEVFANNVDRSSCSCVEGNPCAFSTNCQDWKNRFTIAMHARRAKGSRC